MDLHIGFLLPGLRMRYLCESLHILIWILWEIYPNLSEGFRGCKGPLGLNGLGLGLKILGFRALWVV